MPTKIFSTLRPHKVLDRPTAWACLTANLMVLPGLGSWLLGRRIGFLQMLMALTGFGLTSIWAFWFVKTWVGLRHLPTEIGPHVGKACLGIVLFFGAWLWSLGTSLLILRRVNGPPS